MTLCSVYPIENYNRGMGGTSNFSRPMLPTYRGCTVSLIKFATRGGLIRNTKWLILGTLNTSEVEMIYTMLKQLLVRA